LLVSAVEIYFHECFDLLNGKGRIPIAGFGAHAKRKTKEGKQDVQNATKAPEYAAKSQAEVELTDMDGIKKLMKIVEDTRLTKGNAINHRSSRSHCIVTLVLQKKTPKSVKRSRFVFVDLAGSERILKSEATNLRAEEAKCINQSLTTLGRCICALKEAGSAKGYVRFRESAVTMLLKELLSASNSKASLVVNIAEDPEMIKESVSSLRFGIACGGEMKCKAESAVTFDAEEAADLEHKLKKMN